MDRATNPEGATTLIAVLEELRADGYGEQFLARGGGSVECGRCRESVPASAVEVDGYRRLEGTSDAADMNLVAWGHCAECGAGATLTLGFGPNSSAGDAIVLGELRLAHIDSRGATPLEAD